MLAKEIEGIIVRNFSPKNDVFDLTNFSPYYDSNQYYSGPEIIILRLEIRISMFD